MRLKAVFHLVDQCDSRAFGSCTLQTRDEQARGARSERPKRHPCFVMQGDCAIPNRDRVRVEERLGCGTNWYAKRGCSLGNDAQ